MQNANLIDGNAKNYLFNTLKQCHVNRVSTYYYVLNLGIFVLFLVIVGLVLYNCNKNKITDEEKRDMMERDQDMILSKIRYHQDERKKMRETQMSSLSDLPFTS